MEKHNDFSTEEKRNSAKPLFEEGSQNKDSCFELV